VRKCLHTDVLYLQLCTFYETEIRHRYIRTPRSSKNVQYCIAYVKIGTFLNIVLKDSHLIFIVLTCNALIVAISVIAV
jgi:hypothetical protein